MKPSAIFMDDGGVISDNSLRGPQWERLVADFFVPRLGGEAAAWGKANVEVFELLSSYLGNGPDEGSFMQWWNEYQRMWLREMAKAVGVVAPQSDDECAALANEANVYVTNRVVAGRPGAADAVRRLKRMGLDLYMASGGLSWQLDGYLAALGIQENFTELYGPDLVDRAKYGPADGAVFYERIFEHSGVDATSALVVDDSAAALVWAKGVGAMTCLVSSTVERAEGVDVVVGALSELPELLEGRW